MSQLDESYDFNSQFMDMDLRDNYPEDENDAMNFGNTRIISNDPVEAPNSRKYGWSAPGGWGYSSSEHAKPAESTAAEESVSREVADAGSQHEQVYTPAVAGTLGDALHALAKARQTVAENAPKIKDSEVQLQKDLIDGITSLASTSAAADENAQ